MFYLLLQSLSHMLLCAAYCHGSLSANGLFLHVRSFLNTAEFFIPQEEAIHLTYIPSLIGKNAPSDT